MIKQEFPTRSSRSPSRSRGRLIGFIASALLLIIATDAKAQFGFGFGFGFPRPYVSPNIKFLNSRANVLAGKNQQSMNTTSMRIPDRFGYRQQNIEMQERYNVSSGRSLSTSSRRSGQVVAQRTPATNQGAPTTPAPVTAPSLPITTFVDEMNMVVWPSDAPTGNGLDSLRVQADASIREVVVEYRGRAVASTATVTTARTDLIDYGRPALKLLRDTSTPRIADSFHLFLLSLYESLAQATNATTRRGPPSVNSATPE